MRGPLAVVLLGAAIWAGSAAAAVPAVLSSRDVKLKAAAIRVVASRQVHGKRVVLRLMLYRRIGHLGYGKIKTVTVAKRLKRAGALVAMAARKRKGPNAVIVRLRWRISRHAGKRMYSYIATPTRLVRVHR